MSVDCPFSPFRNIQIVEQGSRTDSGLEGFLQRLRFFSVGLRIVPAVGSLIRHGI